MIGELHHLGRGAAPRPRADELLEQFALADAGDRLAKTYSGGMRRRLDLAATPRGPARGPVPRRADHRPRPPRAHRAVGRPRDARRRGRHDPPDHPVPRGGRPAGRRHRRRRPRPRHRPRRRPRAQAPGRRRPARSSTVDPASTLDDAARHPRPHHRRPSPPSTRRAASSPRPPRTASRASRGWPTPSPRPAIEVEDIGLRQPTLDDVFLTLTGAATEPSREPPRRRP